METIPTMKCPVCKGPTSFLDPDGKPGICSRGCRKAAIKKIQKKAKADQAKKVKEDAKAKK